MLSRHGISTTWWYKSSGTLMNNSAAVAVNSGGQACQANTDVQIGSRAAVPDARMHLSLGGGFSAVPGGNPKLGVFDDGASVYGFGVSAGFLDAMVPAASGYAKYVGGVLVQSTESGKHKFVGVPVFANNAAAIAGGLSAGMIYRTGADPDPVCIVH